MSSNLLFASANILDFSTMEDTRQPESLLRAAELEIFCRSNIFPLFPGTSLLSGIGFWDGDEEQTTLLEIPQKTADFYDLQYAASLIGLQFNQRAVLVFQPQTSGSARMHILTKQTQLIAAQRTFLDVGIKAWTYIFHPNNAAVYIYEDNPSKGALARSLRRISREYGYDEQIIIGEGNYVGLSNKRSESEAEYRENISEYELQRPGRIAPFRLSN